MTSSPMKQLVRFGAVSVLAAPQRAAVRRSRGSLVGLGHRAGAARGVPADLVNSYGGQLRTNLATGSEVMAEVAGTVSYADRYHEVGSASAGLAHLSAQVSGRTFFGCYLSFQPNPWCGVSRAFFVNKDTGYRVLTETSWCE